MHLNVVSLEQTESLLRNKLRIDVRQRDVPGALFLVTTVTITTWLRIPGIFAVALDRAWSCLEFHRPHNSGTRKRGIGGDSRRHESASVASWITQVRGEGKTSLGSGRLL